MTDADLLRSEITAALAEPDWHRGLLRLLALQAGILFDLRESVERLETPEPPGQLPLRPT